MAQEDPVVEQNLDSRMTAFLKAELYPISFVTRPLITGESLIQTAKILLM